MADIVWFGCYVVRENNKPNDLIQKSMESDPIDFHDRVVGVMVSADDYEAMRAFYADRLLHTMDNAADAAAQAGLTPEKLAELLADES